MAKMKEKLLSDFFYEMYEEFGQYSVINFIRDRQSVGQLSEVIWAECGGCETESPIRDKTCLVCGGQL